MRAAPQGNFLIPKPRTAEIKERTTTSRNRNTRRKVPRRLPGF